VSPFVEKTGLDRRVRRLLSSGEHASTSSRWIPVAGTALLGVTLAGAISPAAFEQIYLVVEAVIAFGR
jgi:hypothetical protein